MSGGEPVEAKARRYLAAGRLLVERIDDGRIGALCSGDSGVWELGWDADAGWVCSCPEMRGRCSHLKALRLVVGSRP